MLTKNYRYGENAKKSRRGSGVGWGGQGGCEQRIEVIVKMQRKSRWVSGWGGQGGCEQRIEVIVKMKKKGRGGMGWGGQCGLKLL